MVFSVAFFIEIKTEKLSFETRLFCFVLEFGKKLGTWSFSVPIVAKET